MRRFVIRTSSFFTCLAIFAFLIGHLIETLVIDKRMVTGNRYSFQGDWHDLANHNSEVLFVGNSRTWVHINPFTFSKKTNLTSEVIGQDGQGPQVLFIKLKEYIKSNSKPQCIVLQFDPNFIGENSQLYGIENWLPLFYGYRGKFTKEFSNKQGYDIKYHYIPLYAYFVNKRGKKLLNKILFNDQLEDSIKWSKTKGFKRNFRDSSFVGINKNKGFKVLNRSKYLDSIFNMAKTKNIKLIGLFSPVTNELYESYINPEVIEKEFYKLRAQFQTSGNYFNYGNIALTKDKNFFYNHSHLNGTGSDTFMKVLLSDTNFLNEFRPPL